MLSKAFENTKIFKNRFGKNLVFHHTVEKYYHLDRRRTTREREQAVQHRETASCKLYGKPRKLCM